MSGDSFMNTHLGVAFQDFLASPRDRAAALVRRRIPDLLWFLRRGTPPGEADAPRRTQQLAASLEAALVTGLGVKNAELQNLRDRIVTDGFLRSELDRDQNVFLNPFFTRVLTRAIPDVVFQPRTHQEIEVALAWARAHRIGITTRGAGTTALGGAVPNDGGLLLEMSRFDHVLVDREDGIAVIGAGARCKQIHAKLATERLALKTYPSNLGGTLAGWFSAGGLGLNGFAHGNVRSQVRALSIVLPRGEHVRFHDDGRLDVLSPATRRLGAAEAREWLEERGYPPLRLADLAQTEGQFGVILTLTLQLQPQPRMLPHFFEFETDAEAIAFARWVAKQAAAGASAPANLKYLSAAHVAGVRRLRGTQRRAAKPSVYLDFETADQAQRFESRLAAEPCKGGRDDAEARRWFADRFRPQQTKRLGPGYLASEILMPAAELPEFVARATGLASRVGVQLETEAYFYGDGQVLALPGYLSRGPRRGFTWELLLVPMLLDLAMRHHAAKPYVLGRWQSPYFRSKVGRETAGALRDAKKRTDRERILNRGVLFAPAFRSPFAQGFYRSSFPGAVRVLRGFYGSPLFAPLFRALIGATHAAAGDAPRVRSWRATAAARAADLEGSQFAGQLERWTAADLAHAARGCVDCGECNSLCPVFHDARIRLPQMLTHLGERLQSGREYNGSEQLLLDLCTRCGNCQEVCQADIPHLPLYAAMDEHAGAWHPERQERQVAILSHLRHSERYLREFLQVRPGGYLQRTPASLPGEVRYVLFRAENDAGPTDTCVHCGACVPVCPTHANLEFEATGDSRRITTDLNRCIGCGVCVEVCPANQQSGGRTLRVMEAPAREFFDLFAAFESRTGGSAR